MSFARAAVLVALFLSAGSSATVVGSVGQTQRAAGSFGSIQRVPLPPLALPHDICGVDLGVCCPGNGSDPILGIAVSDAGDVNADGYPDLIVGATGDDSMGSDTGRCFVISGRNGTTLFSFFGNSPDADFGAAVSGAGDVNGDGRADLLVGAPYADSGGSNTGTVFVYSGSDGSLLYALHGGAAENQIGRSLSEVGDIDQDGFDDFIVGGRVLARVHSGADGSILYGFSGAYAFGTAVSGAGDVNADGVDDFVIGNSYDDSCASNGGVAKVYSGASGSVIRTFCGQAANVQLGRAVSGAGDVNADGFDDLIFGGSISLSTPGKVWVYSGKNSALLYSFVGHMNNERFGESVSGAGDVNGDGFDDFIVGAQNAEQSGVTVGAAWVYSGLDGSILQSHFGSNPPTSLSYFGISVSGAGDVNRDGLADFIVGVPGLDDGAGCAVILPGAP